MSKKIVGWLNKCAPCFTPDHDHRLKRIDSRNNSSRGGSNVVSMGSNVASTSSNVASTSMSKEEEAALSFWSRDLVPHYLGNFSFAVIQANINLEDYSQVEAGSKSTFVGVYDGHGGHLAANHVRENLTKHLMRHVKETGTMSMDSLTQAFLRTEQSWIDIVIAQFKNQPILVANSGSCCLVGVIWKENLYVANVGDSRAIIGRQVEGSDKIVVEQLTRDDNVKDPKVRAEVRALHPDEPDIVINNRGTMRIKGRLQVSKSIGDACFKIPRFSLDRYNGYKLNKPVRAGRPAVSARPIPTTVPLGAQDRFVIFASDGLWDQLSNQEAADIVHEHPKEGIAARLIRAALAKAAERAKESYDYILKVKVESGDRRRYYYDDITVVVLFLNQGLQGAEIEQQAGFQRISVKGGRNMVTVGETNFTALDELDELEAQQRGGTEIGSTSKGTDKELDDKMPDLEDVPPALT